MKHGYKYCSNKQCVKRVWGFESKHKVCTECGSKSVSLHALRRSETTESLQKFIAKIGSDKMSKNLLNIFAGTVLGAAITSAGMKFYDSHTEKPPISNYVDQRQQREHVLDVRASQVIDGIERLGMKDYTLDDGRKVRFDMKFYDLSTKRLVLSFQEDRWTYSLASPWYSSPEGKARVFDQLTITSRDDMWRESQRVFTAGEMRHYDRLQRTFEEIIEECALQGMEDESNILRKAQQTVLGSKKDK